MRNHSNEKKYCCGFYVYKQKINAFSFDKALHVEKISQKQGLHRIFP